MNRFDWHFSLPQTEAALEQALQIPIISSDGRTTLHEAMRYAVLGGGKRLRAQLALECAFVAGGESAMPRALPAACAIEFIHAYSLVHDDLPAMDNADLRRGLPSTHKKFGDAMAILAGDALLTLAFEVMCKDAAKDAASEEMAQRLRATQIIAQAAGEAGMVGGQAIDIDWSAKSEFQIDGTTLLSMHSMKTGALIRAACEAGAVLGGGNENSIKALRNYGIHLGRAFQITDDLLDVNGNPEDTGKESSDENNNKITAPAVFGVEKSRALACEAADAAIESLAAFGIGAQTLKNLAQAVVERKS
jgi:geranylgeranyl diphosphate synthase type II